MRPFRLEARTASMASGDFLKKDALTQLSEDYVAAGMLLRVSTNSQALLEVAREAFPETADDSHLEEARLRLWVDPSCDSGPPWPKPYYRGLGHLVFAGFDAQNSLLIDLRERSVLGRFTPALVDDRNLWKQVVFPVMFEVLGTAAGMPVIHSACVARNGNGLLLAGKSGSGKSSLSLALAQAGFDFLSDDRTVLSLRQGQLLAWGLAPFLKLPLKAATQFPELARLQTDVLFSGEEAFHFDPMREFGVSQVRCCGPRWILLLEREPDSGFTLESIPAEDFVARLEEGLHRDSPEVVMRQQEAIRRLAEREFWVLRYGGNPHVIAKTLRASLTEGAGSRKPRPQVALNQLHCPEVTRTDLLHRFTPTPLVADLAVMGRTIRLETNSSRVFEQISQALAEYGSPSGKHPDFEWKVITEAAPSLKPRWPRMRAFSDEGLRYVNLGQRSFLALDLRTRQAIAFLAEELAQDAGGFHNVFLSTLFELTAGSLGLTVVWAACVALGEKGLLVFGPSESGKTTSVYLAGKRGLEFHADQATFLEIEARKLRAWGQFYPAVFRTEAELFLPELPGLVRTLAYDDSTLYCLEKSRFAAPRTHGVVPMACIFLERRATGVPRLLPLSARELSRELRASLPFKDDASLEPQHSDVLRALAELPAYRLAYGSDPSVATIFFRSLLGSPSLQEAPG
jgi:hypothetical protein